MSKTIRLSIFPSSKILVEEGDKITTDSILAKSVGAHELETIHIAKLLSVKPKDISRYLKKSIGEKITSGDILAVKKGFFSQSMIKSPIDGKLEGMDLSAGTISISKSSKEIRQDIVSPLSGKVISIGKTAIELEVANPILPGIRGEGKDVAGSLKYLPGEIVGTLDIKRDSKGMIVLCKSIEEAAAVKSQVVGIRAFITCESDKWDDNTFTFLAVDEAAFKKLVEFDGKKIWLRPNEKQIIIL